MVSAAMSSMEQFEPAIRCVYRFIIHYFLAAPRIIVLFKPVKAPRVTSKSRLAIDIVLQDLRLDAMHTTLDIPKTRNMQLGDSIDNVEDLPRLW